LEDWNARKLAEWKTLNEEIVKSIEEKQQRIEVLDVEYAGHIASHKVAREPFVREVEDLRATYAEHIGYFTDKIEEHLRPHLQCAVGALTALDRKFEVR
jgi:hypothetical protein